MPTATLERARILICGETLFTRELIGEVLSAKGYEVIIANSGEEALARVREMPIDLLLVDSTATHSTPFNMLRRLRERSNRSRLPAVILAETADKESVQQASELGIQALLLKSQCTPELLCNRVRDSLQPKVAATGVRNFRALRKHEGLAANEVHVKETRPSPPPALSKRKVLQLIRDHARLQPLPAVLCQVISQTQSSSSSLRDVVETIRQDQALAVRVIKVANSCYYARGSRARNLLEAAERIGMRGIRNAVTAVVCMDHFTVRGERGIVPQRFWEHSFATALLGQALAEHLKFEKPEEVFLAGLLHDVGRLTLSNIFAPQYIHLLETASTTGTAIRDLEKETFGLDHTDITREVLKSLHLDEATLDAASLHDCLLSQMIHDKSHGNHVVMPVLLVALANRVAHAFALGDSGDSCFLSFEEYAEAASVDLPSVKRIGKEVIERIEEVSVYYASQGEATLLEPFAQELWGGVDVHPRVAVLSENTPCDSCSTFFGQMGWISYESPNVAVIPVGNQDELARKLSNLLELEKELKSRLGIVAILRGKETVVPQDLTTTKPVCSFREPVRYSVLIDAIKDASNRHSAES